MSDKRKNIIALLFTLVITMVVVGALLYIGSGVNKRRAPNAPESQPQAGSCSLEFTITGPAPTPTPSGLCVGTADIAIVLDRSGSMNSKESDGRTKLAWAKDAANAFVDKMITSQQQGSTIRISVSSFGSQGNDGTGSLATTYNSTLHTALTSDLSAVKTAISNVVYKQSGTCIECGIRIGTESLATSTSKNKMVILLSDGRANHTWKGTTSNAKPAAITAANTGRISTVRYFVIGYGPGVDETTLKAIAGTTGSYVYKPNATDWLKAFENFATEVCATPTPSPTPTPTPTASPTPTPSPTPLPACDSTCLSDADCPASMSCTTSGQCRNSLCVSSSTCVCPTPTPVPTPTPTPIPQCSSDCVSNEDCPASMTCSAGLCRNPSCNDSNTCVCPTPLPTPTPVAVCNSPCVSNSDCPSDLICESNRCRRPGCTAVDTCSCGTPGPTPIPTSEPTPLPTYIAQASQPQEKLPSAGSTFPTIVIISIAMMTILIGVFGLSGL